MNQLLEQRNAMKAKKPRFLRQDANKVASLEQNWRRPQGIHSGMRRGFRGHPSTPSIGYGSPKEVRGLSKEGFKQIVVHTEKELDDVKGACIISSTVGTKKRIAIIKRAQTLHLKILNLKDPAAFIKQVEESLKKRKEEIKSREEKKKVSKEEALKRAKEKEEKEKKEKTAEEQTKEQKEKEEKETKRKVLEQQ